MSTSKRKCFLEEQTQRFPEVPWGDQKQSSSSGKPLELMKPSSPVATILDNKKNNWKSPSALSISTGKLARRWQMWKMLAMILARPLTLHYFIIIIMLLDLKMPACDRLRSLLLRVLVAREVSSLVSEKKMSDWSKSMWEQFEHRLSGSPSPAHSHTGLC